MEKVVIITANSAFYIKNFRYNYALRLKNAGHRVVLLLPASDIRNPEVEKDFDVIYFKLDRGSVNPFKELASFVSIFLHVWRMSPNLILSSTPKINIYMSLVCRSLNIPLVINISGLGSTYIKGGLYQKLIFDLYSVGLSNIKHVFFENDTDHAIFKEKGLVCDNSSIIPGLGVDTDFFSPKVNEVTKQPIDFLMLSRFIGDKGVREYLMACQKLHAEGIDAVCCLMGDYDIQNPTSIDPAELVALARTANVKILPFSRDVRDSIANAKCIVLPSYREGLSRVLLEAGAMGKPCITTNVPGCKDVINDGFNGYLCEARNADDLFSCLVKFLRMPDKQKKEMGGNARNLIVENFCESIVHRHYDSICLD